MICLQKIEKALVDSFIQGLEQEGSLDSGGVFTIDVDKAKSKLSQFQLAKFGDFLALLYSAAVASSTHTLKLRESSIVFGGENDYVDIFFFGLTLRPSDLHQIAYTSLQQNVAPHLRYLAFALSTVCARYPAVLLCDHPEGSVRVELSRDGVRKLTAKGLSVPEDCTRLRVRGDLGVNFHEELRNLSWWSNLEIDFEAETVEGGINLAEGFKGAQAFFSNRDRLEIPVWLSEPQKKKTYTFPQPARHPLFLAYTSSYEAGQLGLMIVIDGIAYPSPLQAEFPNISGYIVANHLARDLSFSNLVRNEAYFEVEQQIKEGIASLLAAFLEATDTTFDRSMERSLYRLEKDVDISRIRSVMKIVIGRTVPVRASESAAFQRLLEELQDGGEEEISALLQSYANTTRSSWEVGRVELAADYLSGQIELRRRFALPSLPEERLLKLFDWFSAWQWPDETEDSITPYLVSLKSWCEGQKMERPSNQGIHASWYQPMEWESEEWDASTSADSWQKVWALCSQSKPLKALNLLKTADAFQGARVEWLSLFWQFYKGQLPWPKALALRVEYSVAGLGQEDRKVDARGFEWTLISLRNRLMDSEGTRVVPHLLAALLCAQDVTQRRRVWGTLLAHRILERSFLNPESPLEQKIDLLV